MTTNTPAAKKTAAKKTAAKPDAPSKTVDEATSPTTPGETPVSDKSLEAPAAAIEDRQEQGVDIQGLSIKDAKPFSEVDPELLDNYENLRRERGWSYEDLAKSVETQDARLAAYFRSHKSDSTTPPKRSQSAADSGVQTR